MLYSWRMKIGEIAKHVQLSIDSIRYYEQRQLLHPKRTTAGYRDYSDKDLKRLRFIIQAKALGFTLEEIKQLLCLQSGNQDCFQEQQIAQRKSQDIAKRIGQLTRMQSVLEDLAKQCESSGGDTCPILKSLEDNDGK